MAEKILFVDDDTNLLASYVRNLGKQFELDTAEGGELGLTKLAQNGPFAVVVADRQMPKMDGIKFLTLVKEQAPATVRIMLTGNADLEVAIRAVNEGDIFRFLTKPCSLKILAKVLKDAQAQYQLVMAEKELLSKTLNGSIKLLTDILSMVDTGSFGRAQVMRNAIAKIAGKLQLGNAWEIHLAVMLAPIGYVTIPPEILVKSRKGEPLSEAEAQMLARVPDSAARLLANIPRLEGVARIVQYQHRHFDGSDSPPDGIVGEAIPIGSRLLKILLDMAELERKGMAPMVALKELQKREGHYDPALFSAVRSYCENGTAGTTYLKRAIVSIPLSSLTVGMVLQSNVETKDGTIVLAAGQLVNEMALEKIQNFARLSELKEPIRVETAEPVGSAS